MSQNAILDFIQKLIDEGFCIEDAIDIVASNPNCQFTSDEVTELAFS